MIFYFLGLHANLMDAIVKLYDIDSDLRHLRENASTLKTQEKISLWRNLLTKSFTRLTTLIYASTLFVITMRIQLNLLGGYLYKEIDSDDKELTKDIQNRYLSLIQNFFTDGIIELAELIKTNVDTILSKYDLKQKLSLVEVEQIFQEIQVKINEELEKNKRNKLANIVLKEDINQNYNNHEQQKKMLIETIDLLETDEFFVLFTQHVGNGFSLTVDELLSSFAPNQIQPYSQKPDMLLNLNDLKIPLAKVIPIINGLIPKAVNGKTLSGSFLRLLINSDKIQMFGANVYEVFSM